jgi:hypothetical protein
VSPKRGAKSQWVPIRHLNGDHSLSDAMRSIEEAGKPGLYRVIQTQRQIWAQVIDDKLRLRKWHAMTPESLRHTVEAFDRDDGNWPEKAT